MGLARGMNRTAKLLRLGGETFLQLGELARGRFDSFGEAKMELFDYIEVFYNQQRWHSTIGRSGPAAFERRFSAQGA
jgi:transposase InsO family protein